METRLLAVEVDGKPETFKTVTTGKDVELFNKQPINDQKPVTVKRESPGSLPVISSPNNDDITFSSASGKVYQLFTSSSALFLPGKIQGHSVKYLLDTGCSLNLLSRKIFKQLSVETQERIQPFQGAGILADNSILPFDGQLELPIKLRSQSTQVKLVVADIGVDAILGMEFFRDRHCQLLFSESTLVINGIHLSCTDESGGDLSCRAEVVRAVTSSASSEKLMECRLKKSVSSTLGFLESCGLAEKHGLAKSMWR